MGRVLATADIGSNTVHMLIAETDGKSLTRLDNRSEWVSLGETVARKGVIPADLGAQLIENLKGFKRLAKSNGAEYLYVFATEAMRLAENHEQLLETIFSTTEIAVDVITPRREAELSLRGILLDSPQSVDLMIEVGGGSAQIARVSNGRIVDSASAPLGTGRLIAEAGLKNPCPPSHVKAAERFVHDNLESLKLAPGPHPHIIVASGGVIRGLWRSVHPDGEPTLHRNELAYLAWAAAHLPVSRVISRFGVKNKRAATLLPGALVYGGLMDRFEITDLHVSEYGVREGAIIEIAKGSIQGCLV